jgi:WD40 repeat protein
MTVYSPDGKRFLAGNKILDADTGLELASFAKEFDENYEIDASGTNREKRWIIIGHERYINTLVVWDAETGGEIQRIQSPLKRDEHIHLVSISPDGGKILVNIKSNILFWDIESGNLILSMTTGYSIDRLIFSPDGKKAIFCGYKEAPVIWDFESGNTVICLGKEHEDSIVFIGHNPYENQIITVSKDKDIKVWDVKRGKCRDIATGMPRQL